MSQASFKHLRVRLEQGIVVITVAVPYIRSTAFELVDALREELFAAVADTPKPKVILDLSEIEFFGSAGIRPLLGLRRQIQNAGGRLLLCCLSPQVEEVLQTTHLIGAVDTSASAFDVAPDVGSAVARLASPK
jgi:anti-anti-sigma factor